MSGAVSRTWRPIFSEFVFWTSWTIDFAKRRRCAVVRPWARSQHVSAYSDSLLLNLTNNPAESFNSIICKEIGGKRINFGARGSYNARVTGAVAQYNTQQVLTRLHENICNTVPPMIENL